MSIMRRATEQQATEWQPAPEGLWRWEVGKPEVSYHDGFGAWRVKFPLMLTEAERERLKAEHGDPEQGKQQSWRTSYTCGLSLGFFKNGQYQSTKLVDFLSACFGHQNSKRFRQWVMEGGGPPIEEAGENDAAVIIATWLGWVEGCELYGSVRHEPDKANPSILWARFGGPMAVGALPGQKDDAYQAQGLGKMRAMMTDRVEEPVAAAKAARQEAKVATFVEGDLPI